MGETLQSAVEKLRSEFSVSDELLNKIVDALAEQATQGLAEDSLRGMPMIPTYVNRVPTGKEKGLYLATDLGGTNFRVCSVVLDGDSHFKLSELKWPVPPALQKSTTREFFDFLAGCVEEFMKLHHSDRFAKEPPGDALKMGFTFSFPVQQTRLDSGTLIRWTKGFDIKDTVGKDICYELQSAIDRRKGLHIKVVALINDTVGALMARAYTNSEEGQTMVGAIIGTGTNCAYTEKISKIKKFNCAAHPNITSKIMVVNTEWGSFDNDLHVLPVTRFDKELNEETPNKDFHMFEKRISGMFIGELLRLVLVELHGKGLIFAKYTDAQLDKAFFTPWSTDTSAPSISDADASKDLDDVASVLKKHYNITETTLEEREAVKQLSHSIAKRGAYLAGAAFAGLLKLTNALKYFKTIDIGADGTMFERYPGFEKHLRESMRKTFLGSDEARVSIGLAKDGSGVGAALCAAMAD